MEDVQKHYASLVDENAAYRGGMVCHCSQRCGGQSTEWCGVVGYKMRGSYDQGTIYKCSQTPIHCHYDLFLHNRAVMTPSHVIGSTWCVRLLYKAAWIIYAFRVGQTGVLSQLHLPIGLGPAASWGHNSLYHLSTTYT